MNLIQYVCLKGGDELRCMQCCSPFNVIAEKSEMAVKDQENRESIIFYILREGCIRQTLFNNKQ